jgi:hypothetical protein
LTQKNASSIFEAKVITVFLQSENVEEKRDEHEQPKRVKGQLNKLPAASSGVEEIVPAATTHAAGQTALLGFLGKHEVNQSYANRAENDQHQKKQNIHA